MEGEMLKGHLDMIVLAALSAGPAHGYAVIEEIKRRSGGAFTAGGHDHPVLHRLEEAGLLAGRWVIADSGRRRRVYSLTRRGERELGERRAVWERFSEAVGSLFKGSRAWRNPA